MKTRKTCLIKSMVLISLLSLLVAGMGWAAVYKYDLGDAKSPVAEGFTAVTNKSVFPAAEAGWVSSEGLIARDKAYTEFVDSYRGKVPPPMWTSPLSQDSLIGKQAAEFAAKVEPGHYRAWVLCGVSHAYRAQVFSFDVSSGDTKRAVQFENSYQYRVAELPVDATGGEARLTFTPRSLFAVAAIVLFSASEGAQVREQVLEPELEIVNNMPPAEMAKWKYSPRLSEDGPPPSFSEADRQRGYAVHHRHWAEVVFPKTAPIPWEQSPRLRAFASPGEYEPFTFIVQALQELTGAAVTVSDLKSARGTIPAGRVEIRRVKYMKARPNYTVVNAYRLVPDPLMPHDPAEPLPAGENTRYWLTVQVPGNAAPGTYQGTVTLTPHGRPATTLPLQLRVLPIKLQEDPGKIYGIYYRDPLDDWTRATDEFSKAFYLQKAEWEMQDLVAHGTRNVVSGLWSPPEKDGKFEFNFDLMQQKLDLWKKYNFQSPVVIHVNAGGIYRKHTGKELGSHIALAEPPPPEYGPELTRMCQAIEVERKKRGWPEFLYYPIDEPSTAPGPIAFMVETLKAVQAAGVRTYVTADPTKEGFLPLRPYIDVWCTQPFLPTREEILKDKAARKVDYWCYPNHVNGENDHTTVNGARMTYGFGFWRSGFTTLIPWIYRADVGNPWNYLDGSSSDFFNRTEDSGRPIPVTMWEAYREGYDDYRYVYTLEQLIAKGRKQGGKAAQAATAAQKELDWVWKQIRVQEKYKWDDLWEPREIDVYRWIVAEQILKLQSVGVK